MLDTATVALASAAQAGDPGFANSKDFEKSVLRALRSALKGEGVRANASFHAHAFPDIIMNGYGVEVKHTVKDSWLSVGNSIFEGMRDETAKQVYVVFGKFGGWPEVRWARYEDCVTHVRISHAPRFVIEMDRVSPLFRIMDIAYDTFRVLSPKEKMHHVREYSRNRLKAGERLWWLEDQEDQSHTLPMQVRVYRTLPEAEQRRLRAEGTLLCPQVCRSAGARGKYDDVALYLLTRHGVLCSQVRDLFSAGSVALRADDQRGGKYLLRALQDIQPQIVDAAQRLDEALFVEYWGEACPPNDRIKEWLRRADGFATDWTPSRELFVAN